MPNIVEIHLPDIGDFAEVPVIELLVKPGDDVAIEQSLLALESDKATLEVPSPFAGRIETLTVAIGDLVSKGSRIGTISVAAPENPSQPPSPAIAATEPLCSTAVIAAKASSQVASWSLPFRRTNGRSSRRRTSPSTW